MVTVVKKSDVPVFLRDGERYQSMDGEDEVAEVPEGCFAKRLLMTKPADLKVIMNALAFWEVRNIPIEVKDFAMLEMEERDLQELREAGSSDQECGLLAFVRELVLQRNSVRILPSAAVAKFKADADTAMARAAQYCWHVHRNLEKGNTPMTCAIAAQADDLEALKVLVGFGFPTEGVPLMCFDHLQSMVYLREKGVACGPELCELAARQKKLPVLQVLHENAFLWDVLTCRAAAEVDALDCLTYAHEHGCVWDTSVAATAASKGSLSCLAYLHEHGCPWDETATHAAASAGEVECLQYLHEHGCPWGEETMTAAASKGQPDCLRYLLREGCPKPANLCITAAGSKNVATLRCAREYQCPWDAAVAAAAVASGHLPMVKYVIQQGCPIHQNTIYVSAIDRDDVRLVEFLHELGVPWTDAQTDLAAMLGKPVALAAMHAAGCPLSKDALTKAAIWGNLECFQYLHEHGCKWDAETFKACERALDRRVLKYALDHKCPRSGDKEEWVILGVSMVVAVCVALVLINFGA
jgi:hypothetical protein